MSDLISRYSMVKDYRRCPKAYEYKWVRNLQRRKPAVPLLRGTILHELLDMRAQGKRLTGDMADVLSKYSRQFGTLFKEERETYGEDFLGDIRRIYEGYDSLYSDDGWVYEESEALIETQLTHDIGFAGHIDKVVVTKRDKRRWIVDHKTHKHIPDEEQRFNDYQILVYVWAWNRENPKKQVDGLIWDYLRTKAPTIPDQLKNGQLSQAKNIDTDLATYTRELRRLKLDPRPYEAFLLELRQRSERRFYVRISLPAPSQEMTQQVVDDFKKTSMIMHGIKEYPRTMTRDCSWCEYYRLCSSELRGLDSKYVEKAEFEERKPSYIEVGEE